MDGLGVDNSVGWSQEALSTGKGLKWRKCQALGQSSQISCQNGIGTMHMG
jgi:hypothetical protein